MFAFLYGICIILILCIYTCYTINTQFLGDSIWMYTPYLSCYLTDHLTSYPNLNESWRLDKQELLLIIILEGLTQEIYLCQDSHAGLAYYSLLNLPSKGSYVIMKTTSVCIAVSLGHNQWSHKFILHSYICVCLCACVRACMHGCACVHACVHTCVTGFWKLTKLSH